MTKNGIVSYWSALTVHLAKYNNLISKSNDTIICAGQPVVLKVVSEGYNLNYSWFKDNTLIKSGTSPELSINLLLWTVQGCTDAISPDRAVNHYHLKLI